MNRQVGNNGRKRVGAISSLVVAVVKQQSPHFSYLTQVFAANRLSRYRVEVGPWDIPCFPLLGLGFRVQGLGFRV